jgi:alpha-tubulin suppressor-like RCC1 family protein
VDYQVQWRTNGAGSWTTTGWTTSTSTTVTGMTNNTLYEFQVQARNAAGTSAWSASVTATPRQWAQISTTGYATTCAVTVSGRAYCWGRNDAGQVGDGTTGNLRLTATPVDTTTGLTTTNVAAISTGAQHTCAVTTSGRAYCWGDNGAGQIGDSTSGTARLTPTAVVTTTGLTTSNVSQVVAGLYHTCARTTAGQAYCWGSNPDGRIGDNSTTNRLTPTAVSTSTGLTTTNVASLAAGWNNTCAVTTSGRAYCWGNDSNGQVGDNASGAGLSRLTPTAVNTSTGLTTTNVARMAIGNLNACAITTAGQAYCWGANGNGEVGDNSTTQRLVPTPVDTTTGLTSTNVARISLGQKFSCVITIAGRAYCWGADYTGALGDGSTDVLRLTPTAVDTTTGLTTTNVASITAGQGHGCVTTTAGDAYCWGWNDDGELGDGTSGTNRLAPVHVG